MTNQQDGGIAWCDFTSNPLHYHNAADEVVWGCVKVSQGCTHCYAESLAKRFDRGAEFNAAEMAKLTPYLDEQELRQLLTSKKISGKRVFIEDMSDLFGEWVPFELLDRLFAAFALRPDVTFQILTKRPERMREYINQATDTDDLTVAKFDISGETLDFFNSPRVELPLPNVWLGASVENQETADERIPLLLQTPAAVRFVSYEPALEGVNFSELHITGGVTIDALNPAARERVSWVIVGGESGPSARPTDIEWIRSIMEQCKSAGVPAFVKQVGSRPFCSGRHGEWKPKDRKGGDMSEWSEDLRVREFPQVKP